MDNILLDHLRWLTNLFFFVRGANLTYIPSFLKAESSYFNFFE